MQNFTNAPQNRFSINCGGRLLELSTPKIMGILNLTPDSFSDGGKFNNEKSALLQTEKMLSEGASIIDIGPQSTRPNAEFLNAKSEIERLGNLIFKIKKEFPEAFISIDSFHAETVRFAHSQSADIINDISGGQFDNELFTVAAETGMPYILMHINPSHDAMHEKVNYENITVSLNQYFSEKTEQLKALGVKDIILDPGFGFGKTVENQHELLDHLQFTGFGRFPVLTGISRKSFIYKPLGKSPLDINSETQKLHLKALKKGTKILRVHDVAEARKTIDEFLNF